MESDPNQSPESRRSEAISAQRASLIDLIPDAIVVRDREDRVTFWSRGAESLYGWSSEEAVGRKMDELLQTVYPEPLDEIAARLVLARPWEGELVRRRHDGGGTVAAESAGLGARREAHRDAPRGRGGARSRGD